MAMTMHRTATRTASLRAILRKSRARRASSCPIHTTRRRTESFGTMMALAVLEIPAAMMTMTTSRTWTVVDGDMEFVLCIVIIIIVRVVHEEVRRCMVTTKMMMTTTTTVGAAVGNRSRCVVDNSCHGTYMMSTTMMRWTMMSLSLRRMEMEMIVVAPRRNHRCRRRRGRYLTRARTPVVVMAMTRRDCRRDARVESTTHFFFLPFFFHFLTTILFFGHHVYYCYHDAAITTTCTNHHYHYPPLRTHFQGEDRCRCRGAGVALPQLLPPPFLPFSLFFFFFPLLFHFSIFFSCLFLHIFSRG